MIECVGVSVGDLSVKATGRFVRSWKVTLKVCDKSGEERNRWTVTATEDSRLGESSVVEVNCAI